MADPKQFRQLTSINHGTTAESNIKMLDYVPMQHENNNPGVNTLNKLRFAQLLCQPYAEAGAIGSNNTYNATCSNFPDFNVKYQENGVDHYFVGLKVRVKFANGITYGSTSSPVTYPLLNINNTEAFPILAQGKTVGAGAASAGQTLEFTLIRYGNDGYAWDADSNVRESTSDYTIYTDGSRIYKDVTRPIYKEGIAIPTNTEQKVHDLLGQGCYLICAYMENAQYGSYAFYSKTNYNEYVTTISNYLVDISIKSDGIYIKNRTPYSFTTYFRIVKLL